MNKVVARFAPSPTGFLHIGGIRTALINYIIIQQNKLINPEAKFLLRIEDTDKLRSKDEYKDSIIQGLKWLGINWDDNEYLQSKRIKRHIEVAEILLKKKYAFKCICTAKELEKRRSEYKKNKLNIKRLCTKCEQDDYIQNIKNDYCIRIKIPNSGKELINDKIQGKIQIDNKEIDNFILLRKDKTPTYMLSVVVDDYDMNVNYIIRGDDHVNNTFRQLHIYKNLNWEIPQYAHLPLIHGMDGAKLSKRHGAIDINELKKIGYLPQSIINNLILLGWSPKKDNEFIELKEIINNFDIKEISKSSSIFNYDKLNHFNSYYIQKKENYNFFENYINENLVLKKYNTIDKEKMLKIFNTYKQYINNFSELEEISKVYFENFFEKIDSNIIEENFKDHLLDFLIILENLNLWEIEKLEKTINEFIKNKKISFAKFGKSLRFILIFSKNGPSLANILYILGKKNTFLRINKYINSSK